MPAWCVSSFSSSVLLFYIRENLYVTFFFSRATQQISFLFIDIYIYIYILIFVSGSYWCLSVLVLVFMCLFVCFWF